jgi:autotransporter-associated beta strand protein
MKKSSVLLDTLRRHFKRPVAVALALFFPLWTMQVRGATLYYQGLDGPWDTTTPNWSSTNPTSDSVPWVAGDLAAFMGMPGTLTLGGPISAGGLTFGSDGNIITGGTLTLSAIAGYNSPFINVAAFKRATVNSIIAGTSGLTKTGNGTLVLGNSSNTISGDVVINGGNVVITNQAQLGTGTTTISVNGVANTGNPGFSGGSLILQGGLAGMTLSRDISLSGRGPGATNNGGALISVGNNTIAGNIVIGGTASQGNIVSAYGITTITGNVQLGNGSTQTFFGNGNYIISGQVTGFEVANDRFSKSGNVYGTTLWLQNPNNNFAESLRIDSGTVRVSTNTTLGFSPTTQAVDLNNGILEVRTDTPGVGNADFSARKVFNRDNTNTGIFVSRGIDGSAINQTVVFGETRATGGNTNFRITGRDGFNVTLQGLNNSPTGAMGQGGTNNALIENNSSGLLTLATSSLWNQGDGTARTLTIQGNGDTLLTGSITRTGGGAHTVTKASTGTFTIQGTNSTFIGSFNVNSGTVAINSFGAINNGDSGALQLSAGALSYLGAASTGMGETTAKSVNLTSTTGSGIILANQAGTSPSALIISNGVAATGAGIKSLYLGGASTLQNTIGGVIQNNSGTNTTSLVKIGSGTWLYAPSASSYVTTAATGVTTTGGGAAQSNSFTVSNATGLVVGETVTGSNVPATSIITAITGNTITINNAIGATAVASGTALTFGTTGNFTGNVTVAGGTLQIKATAGSGNGSDVINDTSALIFNVDTLNTNQVAGGTFEYLGFSGGAITESLGALTMTAGAATLKITSGGGATGLTFSSLVTPAIGTGLNVIGNGTVTLTGVATSTATTLTGNGHIYFGGADFARSNGGVLVAPVYDTDAGFVTAGAALTAGNHNLVTANTSSGALTISSLKISGNQTVAQTGLLTINVGANTSGGILMTGGSGTISGTGVTSGGNQDLVVRVDGSTDALLISAPITSTTTGGLTKNGLGTLVLSGANAEAGTVTVNEGTLQLSGTGLLGATNINLTVRQGATFDLNGVNVGTLASGTNSVNTLNGSGIITNSAASGTATLRFGNSNAGGLFTGLIQDGATATVSLVKAGSGTVALTGANTFTGPVTISGGNIDIPNIANIGVASGIGMGDAFSNATNAASLILNGGAIRYVGTNAGGAVTATQTPSVSINRLFTLAGNGTIASYGSYGNLTAGRAANNAALIFNNTADLVFSGTGVRTLTLDGDSQGDNEIDIHLINNPNANEALSLNKNSAGLWILNPLTANTYTGTTTINGGALQAVDGFGLSSGSNLLLNGGVFQSSGTFNRGLGTGAGQFGFTANGNGGFSSGSAKLTVDFSSLGTPVWGSTPNFLGTGVLILNNATSVADVEVKGNFDLAAGVAATPTINTTNANATITITTGNTNGLTIGQAITGSNIPAGTYITSITGLTTFTISQNATATGTLIAATIAGDGFRQIQVDDNGSTYLDFATISGVIGGTGGLGKIGTANLILGDANTYSGRTVIRQDAVFATSIGAAGATSSSFGTNVSGGILELGNPGTSTTVSLMYVGPGETTTREIDLTGTTGTRRIDSSGTGALVLTNLLNTTASSVNTTGGAKTLEIRGTNTDANMITSILTDNGGALTVSKSDGGVWILNPTGGPNTFTGNVQVNQGSGLLGLTSDGIGSAASILLINGGIFAYGSDLTTSTPVVLGNNSTAVFAGSNNMTFNGTLTKQAGANDQTFSNNLENGAVLTFNGNFIDAETSASTIRTINIRGYGATVFNGLVQNNSALGTTNKLKLDIRLANTGSVTLAGDNKSSTLGFTGGILLGQGTLYLSNTGALGPAANLIQLDGGTLTSTVDLSGANKILNQVSLQGDQVTITGSQNIEFGGIVDENGNRFLLNQLTGGATLTLSGTVNLQELTNARTLTIRGTGVTTITGVVANGGTGVGGLAFSGLGSLILTNNETATGALTVNRNLVVLSGANGSWNSGTFALNPTGILQLDNSGGNNVLGRLSNAGTFAGNGGTLDIIGFSSGSTHTAGALVLNSVQSYITMEGGPVSLTFASVNFANSGSSLNLSGISNLGTTNKVIFTTFAGSANAPVVNNIMPRVFLGGADFAAYNGINGVVAFSAYDTGNNLNASAATATLDLTANSSITVNRTVNAIKIDGNGLTVGGSLGTQLTLAAAALINTGGDNTISVPLLNFAGLTGYMQVAAGTTLTINSTLEGTSGLAKSLPGTLVLNTPSFVTSTHNLLNGTTVLNGGLNTFFPGQLLNINNGATLDLNGNAQYIGGISDPGVLPGSGGTITTSTGTGTLVSNQGNATVMTQITGTVNFAKLGNTTLTFGSVQTYTGSTTIMGGTLALQDDSTILNSSRIDINAGTLYLNNNASLQTGLYNRIGDAIPINLRDGVIQFSGKVSDASTETFGALTSVQGANTVNIFAGGTGTAGAFASADVTFASLTRNAGTTINFAGSTAQGSIGNFPRMFFTAPLTTFGDGVLGPWAIANYNDYAAYNTTNGVGTVGNGGYAGYSATFGSGNITDLGTYSVLPLTTTLSGTTTTSMLRLNGGFTNNVAFTSNSDVLNLELGGILRTNNPFDTSIGTANIRGVLTAGGTETSGTRELIVYNTNTSNPTFTNPNSAGGIVSGSSVVLMNSTIGIQPGMTLANANFPAGTTVLSVDSLTQITLSNNATASAQNQTFTGGSFVNGTTASGSSQVTMNSTVGIAPGMIITGTGVPAGTYVVSVDSPTGVTLSQTATANGSALTFAVGVSNMIINSVIADNNHGNSVQFIKSGSGVLNLSANNTYTGGTVIDQGTINLIGSGTGGYVIPAGGLLIGGAALIENTNAGQIDPSNVVTIRRSSTLTLTGNNTLNSLVFDNNGGVGNPVVNVGTGNTLTLTNNAPITVHNEDAQTVPFINGGTLALVGGVNTISVDGPTLDGVLYTAINSSLLISSNITGAGSSILKTGTGILQLSGQSNFGNLTVSTGGILISGNSTPTQGGGGITSGPLGVGLVSMASGTTMLVDSSRAIGNNITFAGTPTFNSTANSVWTLSLNGKLTGAGLSGTNPTVQVSNPFLTVALLGQIPNIGTITSFNKTGPGTLIFNSTGYTGDFNATALGNQSSISLLNDGDGTGRVQTISLGNVVFDAGIIPTIVVGRAGGLPAYNQAQNKIIAPNSISNLNLGLNVTNNNGYGLLSNAGITLTGTAIYSVANATISTVTQGLYLNGMLSGAGFTKTGNGTMVLGYGANNFTGNIVINQGVVSVDFDTGASGELGNAANKVVLSPTTGTATLRATDDITTSRVIQLANTVNTRAIEVSQGKTLTLTSPFDLNAGAGNTAALVKNDNGTLALVAGNSGWSGGLTINAGAVLLSNANGAGSGTITIAPASNAQGAALQLSNNISVANAINLQGNNNQALGGINAGGQLENVSGVNTTTGSLLVLFDALIGADAGSTLNINGGINNTSASARALTFNVGADTVNGPGTINVNSNITATGASNQYYALQKRGAGTLNITTALSMVPTNNINFYAGTTSFNGTGSLTGGNTIGLTVNPSATVVLDNSVTNVSNRLGGRAVTLVGGSLVFVGKDNAASTETLGLLTTNRPGATVTSNPGAGTGTNVLTFSSLTTNTDSTVNFIGTNLGTASNKIIFTTAPTLSPVTTGILARATVNGADFATYAAGTGIAAFTAYDVSNNINSGTTTATLNLTASPAALTTNRTVNAIKFSGASGVAINAPATGAGAVGGTTPFQLTISSGGLLATGGNADSINTAVLAFGGAQAIFHIDTNTSLTVTSALTGTAGWVKDGAGTLTLSEASNPVINRSPNTLSGNANILNGTVVLNGGNNTLPANQFMNVGVNGTLDLNGNSQLVRGLFNDASVENGGGIVTGGSLPSSTLVMNQDNTTRSWAGTLTGALSFMRTGDGTTYMYSNNDYSGITFISGGNTVLRDGGALSQTTDIQIVYATLTLDNTGTKNVTDRVNDAATITLRGGTINYAGRQQYDSTEKFGDVTLLRGLNNIFNVAGGTGVNSTDLSFGALLHAPTSTATLRFNNLGAYGQLGNGVRTTFTQINGAATTNLGDGLVNNIIGGWAIVDREFATYNPVLGIGGLNAVGFATGDGTTFLGTLTAADNIRFGTTGTTTLAGNVAINTLTFTSPNAATTLDLGGNTLTLTAGGLLFGEGTDNVNINVTNGFITAGSGGPADLYLTHANFGGTNRTVSIDAIIKDNGGPLRLIKSSGDANTSVMTLNGVNTYTGGTYVNLGTLIIGSNGYIPLAATPANGLVINGNNATVTQTTAGTINPGNYVTINGNATLNLAGSNTLAGLIFSDDGGGSGASQVVSNFGILTLTGGIVSTTANPASTSTVAGRVDFGSTASTLNISATTFNGQELAALLSDFNLQGVLGSSGGIIKTGNGVLQFSQDIYTGPTDVQGGRIQIAANGSGARFSALTLESGTGLNLNGFSAIFGSLSGSGFVMNSGTSNSASTLTVGFDGTNSTFSGLFYRFNDATPANVGLVKVGVGTLTFDSDGTGSTITGALTISRGAVTFSGNGTSSFPYTAIQVNEGGALNLDNTGASNNDARLRNGAVTLNGGQLNYLGRASTPSAETSTGALTLGPSASVINLTNGVGGTAFLKFGSLGLQGGSTAVVIGSNLGTDTKLLFTAAPALSNGIISRMAVGTDFATYDPTKGIIAYAGYAIPTDVNGAAGTATIKVDATTTGRSLNLARTVNAVDIIDSNVTISSNGLLLPTQGWAISSGGILVNGDNATISTPVLSLGAEGIFRVNGSSLNVTSVITGGSGITKTGPGGLTLSSPQAYTGQTALSLGTLTLAGGRNTILVAPTLTVTASNLQVNGGTFDLNGNDQVVGALLNSNTLAYAGGVITNSSATPAILSSATTTSSIFGANLTGNLAFTKSGNNTLTFPDVQSYTGATIIRSGTVVLQDKAVLYSGVADLSHASVTLNYSTLNLNDSNLNTIDNLTPARLPAGVPVVLNGGTLTLTGGGTIDSAVTINTLTVTNGQASISLVPFLNSGSTVLINIGNFVQDPSTGSVTNFVGYTNNNGLATSTIGGQGSSINGNIILNQINGATGPVSYVLAATTTLNSATVTVPSTTGLVVGMAVTGANIPVGSTVASVVNGTTFTLNSGSGVVAGIGINLNANSGLTNNLIGGWAVADGNTFATYLTGAGVSVMGQTTQGLVAPGFDGANISAVTLATQNISDGSTRTIAANTVANSWRLVPGATQTITINSGVGISLGVGIITNTNQAVNLVGTSATSTLTSPNPFLYVFINQATTSINANITGNISLVKSGGASLTLNNSVAVGSNTYTGTTYVDAGTLNLSAVASNIVIIPGDLTINNATVTMNTNAGQIAASSNVTIHGGGILNLTGTNTLTSLTIYDDGGNGNPTANVSTLLTLTAATAITAGNDNLSYTPTIAGTKLVLSNPNPVINVSAGLSPSGLIITAPLDTTGGGTITKTGGGSLILNGGTANVLTGGLDVQAGTLVFDNTAATNPYGTGTIILENGVAIRGGTAARTVVNAISVLGNLTFGTLAAENATANATNNLTLSGTVTLGGTNQTMTVNGLLMVGTISGQLTGGSGLTKDGLGTLVLSKNTNNYGGATTVNAGVLQLGLAGVIPDGSALTVASGGFFNLNGFNETIGSLAGNGVVVNTGVASTLTTGNDGTDTVFSGIITNQANALNLVKIGAGTQTLTGANNYTGTTTISAGTLQLGSGGTSGSLSASSAITDNGTLSFNRSNAIVQGTDFASAISGTGAVTQVGSGVTTFSGASANTYSGLTTVSAGTLALNMTPGVNAIVGDGVSSKTVPDVLINGGTLKLLASNQIDDSVYINLTSGTFNLNGKKETIYNFTNSGGTFTFGGRGGSLTTTDPTWSGGTNDIGAGTSLNAGVLNISGGANTVHGNEQYGPAIDSGGGVLTVGAGGLNFQGAGNPNLTINSDYAVVSPGTAPNQGLLILNGDVTYTNAGAGATASITNGVARESDGTTSRGFGTVAGTVDLGGATRTFTVNNGTGTNTLLIDAQIIDGGITKAGAGTMILAATDNYSGPTQINAGTLQVGNGTSGSLSGTSSVTVSNVGSTLSGSGSISGSTIINTGAILAPGVGNTNTSNAALTFTATGTALQVVSGGQIQLSLTNSTQSDAGFNPGATTAVNYLNGLTANGANFNNTSYVNNWKTAGSGYDSISLTNGSFQLGTGAGTVKLVDNSGTYYSGEIFKLLDWATLVSTTLSNGGGFTTATDLDLSGISLGTGLVFDTSAFQNYGIIVVVPEPTRMLLLMLGLFGLCYRRRRSFL